MPSVLNVGGGSKAVTIPSHYDSWDHLLLDIDPRRGVDVVCDARLLAAKFPAGSYDAIYCSHNLEHYYQHDVKKVLSGFLHVLKDAGFAEIRVPDIGELIKLMAAANLDIDHEIYRASVGAISAHDVLYGYGPEIEESGQDFYAHKTGFTRSTLARALLDNGFCEVYFGAPMAMLELRAFAFKQPPGDSLRTSLSLGEKFVLPAATGSNARRSVTQADQMLQSKAPDEIDTLYESAVSAWDGGRWSEGASLAQRALHIDPSLAPVHYLLGCCQLELNDTVPASRAFEACVALGPAYPLKEQAAARRALCLAREDLKSGKLPVVLPLKDADKRPVSVIMCYASRTRYDTAAAMYRRLLADVPHQIIGITGAASLAEGYNRGLAQAENEIVVFAHDDVEIVSPDFAARLFAGLREHDMIGIAGTRRLKGGAWHFAGHPHLCGQVAMHSGDGLLVTVYGVHGQSSGKLQALDGLLLATRLDIARRIGFDAATFDGWHLYDLDFSLRAAHAGLDCATRNDILAVHDSQGSYDQNWLKYAERFLAKHAIERGESVYYAPELVSLQMASPQEWRLATERLIAPG